MTAIVGVTGLLGAGKTTIATAIAHELGKTGRRIVTNYHVNFPHERLADLDAMAQDSKDLRRKLRKLEIEEAVTRAKLEEAGESERVKASTKLSLELSLELVREELAEVREDLGKAASRMSPREVLEMDFTDAVFVLDEAYTQLDSMDFSSPKARLLGYFILQSRKRGVDLIWTAQGWGLVYNRLRLVTNGVLDCTGVGDGTVVRRCIPDGEGGLRALAGRGLIDRRPFYSLFDTNEIVSNESFLQGLQAKGWA